MLGPCKCYDRKCIYYQGIKQPDETEMTETDYCDAFPDGIPYEIVSGKNLHSEPLPGQNNDIVYVKKR